MWKPPDICVPLLWGASAPTTQSAHSDDGDRLPYKFSVLFFQFCYILLFSQAQKQSEVFYTEMYSFE